MKTIRNTTLIIMASLLIGCLEPPVSLPDEVLGMAPIYAIDMEMDITAEPPRAIENLGKMYFKAPYLYAVERGRGIHVFDNSDPRNPQPIAFWNISNAAELSIRGNYLYANHLNDLVSIDISDPQNIIETDRLQIIFETPPDFPIGFNGFFECADPELGTVVGWEEKMLTNPQCFR